MFKIINLNLGIIDAILDAISGIIISIINAIMAPFLNLFLSLIHTLTMGGLCGILNACQVMFKILAGSENAIYTNGGETALGSHTIIGGSTGNMVFDFLVSQMVAEVIAKMLILSIALLVVFTIVAIIKQEYSTDVTKPENNKFSILAKSGRALMGMIFVPVLCILGVYASNQLLSAIDSATSNNSVHMGTRVFVSCAFNANRARIDEDFFKAMCAGARDPVDTGESESSGTGSIGTVIVGGSSSSSESSTPVDDVAGAYAGKVHNNYNFGVTYSGGDADSFSKAMEAVALKIDAAFLARDPIPGGIKSFNKGDHGFGTGIKYERFLGVPYSDDFDCTDFWLTFYYYDLWEFDYVIATIVCVVLAFMFLKLLVTLSKRLYEIILLYLASPVVLAMMPLDGGKAIGDWRSMFISKVVMIYAPVAAMNLFMSIFGLFMGVDSLSTITNAFMGGTGVDVVASSAFGVPFLDSAKGFIMKKVPALYAAYNLLTCLFLIAGVMIVDETSSWISKWIGSEDALKASKTDSKEFNAKLKKGVAGAATVGAVAMGAPGMAIRGTIGLAKKAVATKRKIDDKIHNLANYRENRRGLRQVKKEMKQYKPKGSAEDIRGRYEHSRMSGGAQFNDIATRFDELKAQGLGYSEIVDQFKQDGKYEKSEDKQYLSNIIDNDRLNTYEDLKLDKKLIKAGDAQVKQAWTNRYDREKGRYVAGSSSASGGGVNVASEPKLKQSISGSPTGLSQATRRERLKEYEDAKAEKKATAMRDITSSLERYRAVSGDAAEAESKAREASDKTMGSALDERRKADDQAKKMNTSNLKKK